MALIGALAMSFELAAELINFCAFLCYMGVNLAAFREFYFGHSSGRKPRFLQNALAPTLGFLFWLGLWRGESLRAMVFGGIWLLAGLAYVAVRTKAFVSPQRFCRNSLSSGSENGGRSGLFI